MAVKRRMTPEQYERKKQKERERYARVKKAKSDGTYVPPPPIPEEPTWLVVTDDKYELTLGAFRTLSELARASGYTVSGISKSMTKGSKRIKYNGIRCRIVHLEEEKTEE